MDRLGQAATCPQQSAKPMEASVKEDTAEVLEDIGVGDGVRTRDVQIHSLEMNSYLVGLPCSFPHPASWFCMVFGA
jgi:uncharacterized protein (DUF362 family)